MSTFARIDLFVSIPQNTPPTPFSFYVYGQQIEVEYSFDNPSSIYFYRDAQTFASAIQLQMSQILLLPVQVTVGGNNVSIVGRNYGPNYNIGNYINDSASTGVVIVQYNPTFQYDIPLTGIINVTNVSIRGTNDGVVSVVPNGGDAPYTIEWADGNTAFLREGLYAGIYFYTLQDNQGAIWLEEITVSEPGYNTVTATAVITNATCYGSATGGIVLSATGGTDIFVSYLWADGATTKDRTNLRAGNYTVTITDSVGNTGTVAFVVLENAQINVLATVNANTITLQVNGGMGAYTYLWSDGATTKDRTNVQPGNYTVRVTDSVGCFRIATIRVEQFQFSLSKNPIPLYLLAENPENKSNLTFVCQVWVEEEYLSGSYRQVTILEQPADTSGRTIFNLEKILDAYLTPYLPAGQETVVSMAQGVFKRFFVRYTEKYGTPPVESTYTQVDLKYVLLGGLSFEEFARNTFFTSYLPSKNPFFTWQPPKKRVYKEQPEYLFYMPNSFTLDFFRVQLTVEFENGSTYSTDIFTQTGTRRYELYCIPAGYNQLLLDGYAPLNSTVTAWEIAITDGVNVLGEIRRYELRTDNLPNRYYLLYVNSLGGVDTLCATGKAIHELEQKSLEIERVLQPDYLPSSGEIYTVRRYAENSLKLSTGYLTPADLEALTDFVLSERVILYLADGRYIGGTVSASKIKAKDDQETANSISFEFNLPKLKAYTPRL